MVSFGANYLLFSLAFIFAIIVSAISYRRTRMPISGKTSALLFALRFLAALIAFLLISEPVLSIFTKRMDKPILAVLIDNSKSMQIKDALGERKEKVKSFTERILNMEINGEKQFFTFAGDIEEKKNFNPDSLKFSGGLTNISNALRNIRKLSDERNIQAVAFITDGVYTAGENPEFEAEKLNIPIITIGIGDSSVQKDLKIKEIITNETTYAGSETPVIVRVESAEMEGKEATVQIIEKDKELARQKISLGKGVNEYSLNFTIKPEEEGLRKFTVKVQNIPGEITYENNQRSFYVRVLKSKQKILILSGAPSPDLAFIKRAISQNKNFELISYTEKKGKEFIEGSFDLKNAQNADLIIFVGYPVKTSDVSILNSLKNLISSQNKPLLFILSRTVDFEKLKTIGEILPFRSSQIIPGEEDIVSLSLTEDGRAHAVMNLRDRTSLWNLAPPVFRVRGLFVAVPGAVVLANLKIQNIETREPAIVAGNFNRRKSIAILCYGLWRWKLMTATNKEFEDFFENAINNFIRWLTAPDEEELIRFKISKEFLSEDEPAEFTAQVYNEDYTPVEDADVSVKIFEHITGNLIEEISLEKISPGIFNRAIKLPRGDYRYDAEVKIGEKSIKKFSGRFTVGESEIEFLNTRMNAQLLSQIAQKTGGIFITPDKFQEFKNFIQSLQTFKPREIKRKREFILWTRVEPLAIVILLLSAEWFIRKRKGLA